MEVWMILHKLRDDGRLRNFENNFRELQQMISILGRAGPFIGRIITKEKFYAGKVEKLKLNDDQLKFTIIDCDADGKTNGNSKICQATIPWKDLEDIQVLGDKKGKPLFLDDLLNHYKIEEEETNE
jgi:hypothetical protein